MCLEMIFLYFRFRFLCSAAPVDRALLPHLELLDSDRDLSAQTVHGGAAPEGGQPVPGRRDACLQGDPRAVRAGHLGPPGHLASGVQQSASGKGLVWPGLRRGDAFAPDCTWLSSAAGARRPHRAHAAPRPHHPRVLPPERLHLERAHRAVAGHLHRTQNAHAHAPLLSHSKTNSRPPSQK